MPGPRLSYEEAQEMAERDAAYQLEAELRAAAEPVEDAVVVEDG